MQNRLRHSGDLGNRIGAAPVLSSGADINIVTEGDAGTFNIITEGDAGAQNIIKE